jgi:hypothetical protein
MGRAAPPFARTFRTRQPGDPDGRVRTCGTVVTAGSDPRPPRTVALRLAQPLPAPDSAYGKVAIVAGDDAAVYQLSDCHTRARLVACGNATAAAAACEAERLGAEHVALRVALPRRRRIRVEARVEARGDRAAVAQTWHDVPFSLQGEWQVGGRRSVLCVSPLNSYLLIQARPDEDAAGFPVAEALALWRSFGLEREPLLSRMAVVQVDGPTPRAKFFTSGDRAHPSAPLTGLAVLALAAGRLGWSALRAAEVVATPGGVMPLPHAAPLSAGAARIEFPALLVQLEAPAGAAP